MKFINQTLNEISDNFNKLAKKSVPQIEEASELIIKSLKNNKKVKIPNFGMKNRRPLASIALTTDTSILTAVSNDFSFDDIFSRQVESIGNDGDVLYAISTSGKSQNVINAIKVAKKLNIKTLGITGSDDSSFKKICDLVISVPASRPDRIQEMHIAVGQIICEILEEELC